MRQSGKHDFLIDSQTPQLSKAAQSMPKVRNYIENLPPTAATWKPSDVPDVDGRHFRDIHVEFLKGWPLHERHISSDAKGQKYVNPNYVHGHSYSDIVAECECGAVFIHNYENGDNPMDGHQHTDDCLPFQRLRARASMQEKRYHYMQYLGWLGWKGSDMAPRFGSKGDWMGALADEFDFTISECYDRYRQAAAETYRYLVEDQGEKRADVAAAYGHAPSTMTRWAKQYTAYEPL